MEEREGYDRRTETHNEGEDVDGKRMQQRVNKCKNDGNVDGKRDIGDGKRL